MMKAKTEDTFYPILDWWVALGILMVLALLVLAVFSLLVSGFPWPETTLGVCALLGVILYVLDLTFFTYYILGEKELQILSLFRYFHFPYREIQGIENSGVKGLISWRGRRRFALSADSLIIYLRKAVWSQISLSPQKRRDFLSRLLNKVDQERSGRVSLMSDK